MDTLSETLTVFLIFLSNHEHLKMLQHTFKNHFMPNNETGCRDIH